MEGKRRAIGQSKLWRLTKRGREAMGVTRRPVPFTHRNLDHILAIGDVYLDLLFMDGLEAFTYEPIEPFEQGTYNPDAFFIFRKKAYVLELQLTPRSTEEWAKKWAVASLFFDSGAFKRASWITNPAKIFKPKIVVISKQKPETVQGGSILPLIHCRDIYDLPSM